MVDTNDENVVPKMYNVKQYLACLQLLHEYVTHFHLTILSPMESNM